MAISKINSVSVNASTKILGAARAKAFNIDIGAAGGNYLSTHSTLPTNLLAYYSFDNASGNIPDETGNLGNLIRGGGTVGDAGPAGGPLHGPYCYKWTNAAYSEDVSPDTVGLPRLTATNLGASSATVNATFAGWFYLDSSLDAAPPTENVLFNTSNHNVWGLFGWGVTDRNTPMGGFGISSYNNTNVAYRSGTTPATQGSGDNVLDGLTAAQWNLLIYRIDNSVPEVKIYWNNSLIRTISLGAAMNHSMNASGQLLVCKYTNNNWRYNGYVNGFGIWDKALTTGEMTDLYNSGNGIPYSA